MRAIAVALVLVFHLWPDAVPGGYIGVDVFLAISGYLITAHLLREVEATGRVALAAFWARRARRLLPASMLVLAFSAVATTAIVPISLWDQFLGEIRASAMYVQNWHLAGAAVDYLAANDPPSPVRHFWSLSVEEQFYAVWPLLVAAAVTVVGRRAPARLRRRAVALVLGAVTLASLVWAIHVTAADPAAAYFVTPARAWEFGAGGLLAILAPLSRRGGAARAVLGWTGVAAIFAAAFLYTSATPFPGVAALLPVLGALALLHAGAPPVRWAPSRALGISPVQRVGDWSYAIYLWHWPLIVLAPFALAQPLSDEIAVAIVLLTLALAALTKVLVEDPVRRGRLLTRQAPRWTFAAVAAGVAVVFVGTVKGSDEVQAQIGRAQAKTDATVAEPPRCFGAAARDPQRACHNTELETLVVPTPVEVRGRRGARCERYERLACSFGVAAEAAQEHVVLLGDSHAAHWRGALEVVAQRRRWRGLSVTLSGCAFSTQERELREPKRSRCARWNRAVPGWFEQHPEVTTVFVSQLSTGDDFEGMRDGYAAAWRRLPETVKRIIVLRDPPRALEDTATCVERAIERHRPAGSTCASAREQVLERDPAVAAARDARAGRPTAVIDLTSVFCGRKTCLPVIGGALVYKDTHHVTPTFSATLGPLVDRALDEAARPVTRSQPAGGSPPPTGRHQSPSSTNSTPRCASTAAPAMPSRPSSTCRPAAQRR